MKTSDLKTRNYVHLICDDGNEVMRIRNIFDKTKSVSLYDASHPYKIKGNIKGIPITEKWLRDFGFVRDGMYWSHKYINLQISETKFDTEIVLVPNSKLSLEIKYVHQLQNVYSAGTEKQLKLKK